MKKLALVFLAALAFGASQPVPQHETTTVTAETEQQYNIVGNLYGMDVTVAYVDRNSDIVTFRDWKTDNLWQMYGIEDWQWLDSAILIMDDMGTLDIEDDAIIAATYTHYTT